MDIDQLLEDLLDGTIYINMHDLYGWVFFYKWRMRVWKWMNEWMNLYKRYLPKTNANS